MSEAGTSLSELLAEMRQLKQEIRERKAEPTTTSGGKGLPKTPVGGIWAQWKRDILAPQGRPPGRPDAKICLGHERLILDLPFEHDDKEITLRDVPVCELTSIMYEAWRQRLKVTPKSWLAEQQKVSNPGKRRDGALYEPTSINRIASTGQSCMRWKFGDLSPIKGIPQEDTEPNARTGYFESWQDLQSFLQYCTPMLRDMMLLSVTCGGMRRREVRLLRIGEVDWSKRVITLSAKRTKTKRERKFPIVDDPAGYDGWSMLVRRKAEAEAIGTTYLFPNPNPRSRKGPDGSRRRDFGKPVPDTTLGNWMREAVRKSEHLLNGEKVVFHHTRHTWGTWSGIQGVSLEDIMREGGWRSPKIALGYVKQARESMDRTRRARAKLVGVHIVRDDKEAA